MNTIKKISILFTVVFCASLGFGQDHHFSQFYASPLNLNPATTGMYDGDWRVMGIYRNQWFSNPFPFHTFSLGYDHNFQIGKHKFSPGITFLNDQSGQVNISVNKIYLSLAFHLNLGKHTIAIGVQPGAILKGLDVSKINFGDQWSTETDSYDQVTGESTPGASTGMFDLNIGVAYTTKIGIFQPEVGFALQHITQPKETFLGADNNLKMRIAGHIQAKVDIGKILQLRPKFLFQEINNSNEILAGMNFAIKLKENNANLQYIFAGPHVRTGASRNTDAFYFIIGANFKNIDVGISYDATLSELTAINDGVGAFEISVIFTGRKFRLEKVTPPCDRL